MLKKFKKKTVMGFQSQTIIIILVMAIVIAFVVLYFGTITRINNYITAPAMQVNVKKSDDNYTVTILDIQGDGKYRRMCLSIENVSWKLIANGNVLLSGKAVEILNNSSSRVRFYDHDDSGELSGGDFFIITGPFDTGENVCFYIISDVTASAMAWVVLQGG
ncbi:MAG: hypothetical protein QMD21_07860 [Candidatus Thermoplasmatota archaeon]|nr:hypothetical protein [Candidatus Thermoplasmatota archaeon]